MPSNPAVGGARPPHPVARQKRSDPSLGAIRRPDRPRPMDPGVDRGSSGYCGPHAADRTTELLREGYPWASWLRNDAVAVPARLLGRRAAVVGGAGGVRRFYDPRLAAAAPSPADHGGPVRPEHHARPRRRRAHHHRRCSWRCSPRTPWRRWVGGRSRSGDGGLALAGSGPGDAVRRGGAGARRVRPAQRGPPGRGGRVVRRVRRHRTARAPAVAAAHRRRRRARSRGVPAGGAAAPLLGARPGRPQPDRP